MPASTTNGLIGGADTGMNGLLGRDTLMVGALGGYLASKLGFKDSSTNFDFQGGTAGAYATYLNGRFFLDALFKADFMNMDWNVPSLGQFGVASKSTHVTSYGAMVDSGYRFRVGSGAPGAMAGFV